MVKLLIGGCARLPVMLAPFMLRLGLYRQYSTHPEGHYLLLLWWLLLLYQIMVLQVHILYVSWSSYTSQWTINLHRLVLHILGNFYYFSQRNSYPRVCMYSVAKWVIQIRLRMICLVVKNARKLARSSPQLPARTRHWRCFISKVHGKRGKWVQIVKTSVSSFLFTAIQI